MELLGEENYAERMDTEVLPRLEARGVEGFFEPVKGQKLHYRHYFPQVKEPRAVLVMLHGFSEGIDKFREIVWYFLQKGYTVWQLQQREHGKSFRSTSDPALVHLTDYSQLVRDLHSFISTIVRPDLSSASLPMFLYAHSMGGGVGACYLEDYPDDFSRAVLSSPMLEMNSGQTPVWAATLYARVMIALGRGRMYMPGSAPFSGKPDFDGSAGNSRSRYDYWFAQVKAKERNQMCVPSISTAMEFLKLTRAATDPGRCKNVQAQVLLLQADNDTFVKPEGQETFIRQIGDRGELVFFPGTKHELYMSSGKLLEDYWNTIDAFFES